jgi:hypothetical protein
MADKKFADFVYDLMDAIPKVNGNPMMSVTSMTDENARYREDPFYISRDRKRLAEEEAKKAAEAGSELFRTIPENDRNNTDTTGSSFFAIQSGETPAERDARVSSWAAANPMQAQVLGLVQQGFAFTPYGMLQNRLSPNYVRDVSIKNIMNRAQTAQANQDYASIARQAALDAARGTALGTTGYGLYNQSANSGDWGWVDNMGDASFSSMVADMAASDRAGNAAAAAAMQSDFGISGDDI